MLKLPIGEGPLIGRQRAQIFHRQLPLLPEFFDEYDNWAIIRGGHPLNMSVVERGRLPFVFQGNKASKERGLEAKVKHGWISECPGKR